VVTWQVEDGAIMEVLGATVEAVDRITTMLLDRIGMQVQTGRGLTKTQTSQAKTRIRQHDILLGIWTHSVLLGHPIPYLPSQE